MAAVARCVNFLGDADSTGSVTGQIAGAFYGYFQIDARCIANLEKWDDREVALRGAILFLLGDTGQPLEDVENEAAGSAVKTHAEETVDKPVDNMYTKEVEDQPALVEAVEAVDKPTAKDYAEEVEVKESPAPN